MADVTLTYKGSDILELSDSGSATLKTGGKYCEDDIAVEYVKPSGGNASIFADATQLTLSNVKLLPKENREYIIDVGDAAVNLWDLLYQIAAPDNVSSNLVIKCGSVTSLYRTFRGAAYFATVTFLCSNQKYLTPGTEMVRMGGVHKILGLPFLATSVTNNNYGAFSQDNSLNEIYFVPNKTTGAMSFNIYNVFVDDTLVSIANAMNAESANTLTLGTTSKARLSAIVGTVSQKTYNEYTDTEETYDFFTADESGTVTLMDFITNTKGWTVA